jgi:RNase P subunit RPR2
MKLCQACERKSHEDCSGQIPAANAPCSCEHCWGEGGSIAFRLRHSLGEATRKWQQYENEYILPCFEMAKESAIDLHKMVRDLAGNNCVILLVKALQSEIKRLKEGKFEPEELQNLCHNIHLGTVRVTREEFQAGCLAEQEKYFGGSKSIRPVG